MPSPFRSRLSSKSAVTAAAAGALVRWAALGALVGVLSGAASALFLHALGAATAFREAHPALLFGLPVAGLALGLVYQHYGKSVVAGSNLLLERIHAGESETETEPEGEGEVKTEAIPFRMAPLVLASTVITHLFGGSAGREGTAVQMGGTLASLLAGWLRLPGRDHRLLLMSGISGGFGAVFGTPLAGTVFGLEVLSVGSLRYDALVPCFVAATAGDIVCRALGVQHPLYPVGPAPALTAHLWVLILVAGALFGGAARLFTALTHGIQHGMQTRVPLPWLRPVLGGAAIIGLTYLVGTRDYLGLSLPLIQRSFRPEGVFAGAFALKLLFTAVTLGTGFKGGEVTPLFCIGAALGAAFAHLTGQPVGFFAALGFVAVFSGAANTPLACLLLGIELFGAAIAVPLAAACILAYLLSGHRGIYPSQRIGTPKGPGPGPVPVSAPTRPHQVS